MESSKPNGISSATSKRPDSLLVRLQQQGFFNRGAFVTLRDFGLFFGGMMGLFHLSARALRGDNDVWFFGAALIVAAFLYALYYFIHSGAIWRMLAVMAIVVIVGSISVAIPPLAILSVIVGAILALRRALSFVSLVPWLALSAAFFLLLLSAADNESAASLVSRTEFSQLLKYEDHVAIYALFAAVIAIWCAIRYSTRQSMYRLSLIFGVAPIMLCLLLFVELDDAADSLVPSGDHVVVDDIGVKVYHADGSHHTQVVSDKMTTHWRKYS